MAPETGVDHEMLLLILLGKLEQKNLGREIIDIGQPKADDAGGELVGDDLKDRQHC